MGSKRISQPKHSGSADYTTEAAKLPGLLPGEVVTSCTLAFIVGGREQQKRSAAVVFAAEYGGAGKVCGTLFVEGGGGSMKGLRSMQFTATQNRDCLEHPQFMSMQRERLVVHHECVALAIGGHCVLATTCVCVCTMSV